MNEKIKACLRGEFFQLIEKYELDKLIGIEDWEIVKILVECLVKKEIEISYDRHINEGKLATKDI